ncbi:MAG: HU family DNA-binding protein [Erysipelotrichaceae bacterium]|nr:HU family DNA-binding protein [Erysipelotrichaceae bacterium]
MAKAKKVTKKDLVEVVAAKVGTTKKDATEAVNVVFDEITKTLDKGGEVDVAGFGKFVVKKRAARTGVNPATGEKIKIAATKVPGFKAAKALKDAVK